MTDLKYSFAVKVLGKSKHVAGLLMLSALTSGCINSPLPAGTTAELYNWENRGDALTSRTAIEDKNSGAFHTGDFIFSDALMKNPELAADPSLPMIIKACEEEVCYYVVVYPSDYSLDQWGLIKGEVSLSGLSTALYHQVKDLPAEAVRARLDELADLVVLETVEDRSYAGLLALDIRRVEEDRSALKDEALAQEAELEVSQGNEPTIMALINARAKKTSELTASREFVFSDSWDLVVDIDVSARITAPSYLMICGDFEREGGDYKVAYNNCALKTDLVDGRFESTLRMTGTTEELLVTIMSLENPEDMQHTLWVREESQSTLRLR